MKLDASCMRYLSKDDYRVLLAVEMGMRNHEIVPVPLISSIAKLRHSGISKILSTLLRYKLLAHNGERYDGYRLSYMGFDILAIHALQSRGIMDAIGSQIGIGKESDVFEGYCNATESVVVVKFHRLGRTSFRSVRKNRDYAEGKSKCSWLYLSRLAAVKEFAYMQALHANGFPTPTPIDQNRHVVVMSKVNGFPMSQIRAGKLQNVARVFDECVAILRRMGECGVVHCDFNEFNILINQETEDITVIDFPQLVSITHPNARELFTRDMLGLLKFFSMKMKYQPPDDKLLTYEEVLERVQSIVRERIEAAALEGKKPVLLPILQTALSQEEEDALQEYMENKSEQGDGGDDNDDIGASNGEVATEGEGVSAEAVTSVFKVPNMVSLGSANEGVEENSQSECSESESEEDVNNKDIHNAVKRERARQQGPRKTRNQTKGRNKYGKIDRSLRNIY